MRRLIAAVCAVLFATGTAVAEPAVFTVDAQQSVGFLKPLRGVNGPPVIDVDGSPPFPGLVRGANVSAGYRMANVTLVRTHDAHGAADIDSSHGSLPPLSKEFAERRPRSDTNVIFRDLGADPDDPASYNFGPTDELIASIYKLGAEPIFRLGRDGGTTAEPPKDLVRYAEVIRHIVLHYNKGWANGFHYGIRYWEVWNEPDLGQIWWRGTPQQFYELYAASAAAIRAADDGALVGGPTLAFVNEATPYREGFLKYVRDSRLPLDFFSWHYYSVDANDPLDFVRISHEMRRLLDANGFTRTLSVLDEWNAGIMGGTPLTPIQHAAYVASAIIYMQDAPIDEQAFYRADGYFGKDGATPDKDGQALIALGRLSETPVRLQTAGGDDQGLAILAARSPDARTLRILISNYQIPDEFLGPRQGPDVLDLPGPTDLKLLPRRNGIAYGHNAGFRLKVEGLAPKGRYRVERQRIASDSDFAKIDASQASGPTRELTSDLRPPGIELITISAQ